MNIFEYWGYDYRSYLHGAIHATIFAVVSWCIIIGLMRISSYRSHRLKQLRRRYQR